MSVKKFELIVEKGTDSYTAELPQPTCIDENESPETICKMIVEEALKTKGYQKLIRDITAETDEALFAVIGYIYRDVTLPLLEENEKYNTVFYSEYKALVRKKDEESKKRLGMLTYFVENS